MAVRLVFLGPPGSGKGTQARRLGKRFNLVALSSGDTLRQEMKLGSAVGRQAEQYVNGGTLVPDDLITDVMLAGMQKLPKGSGCIFDGFPRTVPQAESLAAKLAGSGERVGQVFDFHLPDEVIIGRIVGRRVCTKCGATYNMDHFPPKRPGVCDECGSRLVQREDDCAEVIRTRLETYRSQTAPLVAFYRQRGLLHSVDASRPADQVECELAQVVETLPQ